MSDVKLTKTNQWRYAKRVSFKPRNQAQKDLIDSFPHQKRAKKLNEILFLFFLTRRAPQLHKIKAVYYRENAVSFGCVTFQPTVTNARILQPFRAQRGKVSAIIHKSLDSIINEKKKNIAGA